MTAERHDITALGARGDGLVLLDGDVRFVPGGVPGDVAYYSSEGALERLEEGPNRAPSRCSHFGVCGGCSLQHFSDSLYAEWLKVPIARALEHHGLTTDILTPIVTPPRTRRRCTYSARWQGKDFKLGFAGQKSHSIVTLQDCAVLDPSLFDLAGPLQTLLKPYVGKRETARISLTFASNGVDILLEGVGLDDVNLRMDCASFAQEHGGICRLIGRDRGHDDILFQTDVPVMRLDGGTVGVPIGGFTQATPQGEAALMGTLHGWIDAPKAIADLFSGIGTFSIALTKYAKVDAYEASRPAVQALQAAQLDKTRHGINAIHRDLFRRPVSAAEIAQYDVVILDPPRPGAKAQCETLAEASCRQVLYVSCNANSFARDAKILVASGYTLESVQPVGQFLWSTHVELAAHFKRKR